MARPDVAPAAPPAQPEAVTFRRAATTADAISHGILWKFASQFTVQTFGIAVSLVVARVLAPSEYGAAALVLALAAFAAIFSDVSLGAVLVQRPIVSQAEASSLLWFAIILGLALTVGFALLAPEIASLLGRDEVRPLLLGVAPVFVISTLGAVPTALLNRRMAFRLLELRVIAATATASGCALLIALLGGGAWALVGQQLTQVAMLTSLAWLAARWLPSFTLSRAQLGHVAPFGLSVVGSRTFGTLSANVDNVLVGSFLGTAALGAYAVAYNILLIPLARLAAPVQEVAFPALSSLNDRAAAGRLWIRANAALLVIMTPVMLALAVEGHDFVRVVLGERWERAGPVLRLLAIGGFFQCFTWLTSAVLQSCARQRLLLVFAAARATALIAAFALGLHWGINGVAGGFAIASAAVVPLGLAAVVRSTGIGWRTVVRSLGRLLVAAALIAAVMLGLRTTGPLSGLPALVVVPCVGLVVFASFLIVGARDVVSDLWMLTSPIRRRAAR